MQRTAPLGEGRLAGPLFGGLTGPGLIDQNPGMDRLLVPVNLPKACLKQFERRQLARTNPPRGVDDGN